MDCPACGSPRSPQDKECPRCVYIANTLREHKLKLEQRQQGSLQPPTTDTTTPAPLNAPRPTPSVAIPTADTPVPSLSYETESAPEATAPAHTALISIMWTLTAVEIVLFGLGQLKPPTPFLLEPPALTMAILLIVSKNRIGRLNGGAKLAVDVIAVVLLALLWKMPTPVSP